MHQVLNRIYQLVVVSIIVKQSQTLLPATTNH